MISFLQVCSLVKAINFNFAISLCFFHSSSCGKKREINGYVCMCEYLSPDFPSNKIQGAFGTMDETFVAAASSLAFSLLSSHQHIKATFTISLGSCTRKGCVDVSYFLIQGLHGPMCIVPPWLGSCFNGPLSTFRVSKFSFHQLKNSQKPMCY